MTDLAIVSLAAEINREHAEVRRCVTQGLEHARRAGELLERAKAALPHGQWLPWLAEHCDVSERTAQAYMRVAAHWPALQAKAQRVADLPLRQAVALLAEPRTPQDVVEEARWITWESDWRALTGEEPPLRPQALLEWMLTSPRNDSAPPEIPVPDEATLQAWHSECVLKIEALSVLLRTGKPGVPPPSWRQFEEPRYLRQRLNAWEIYVVREAGEHLNTCDRFSADPFKKKQTPQQLAQAVDIAKAREVIAEKSDDEFAGRWSDDEVRQWAVGYAYGPLVRNTGHVSESCPNLSGGTTDGLSDRQPPS